MSYLNVPGARIHYAVRGQGPLFLLIPGANGDGNVFQPLAERLAEQFQVVTYDRRGFTRSELCGTQDYSQRLATDACDAMYLIRHLSSKAAYVFGTSSGAVVALQLLMDHPDVVRTLIPFEPASVHLLPDGQNWSDFFHEIYCLYHTQGAELALDRFRKETFAPVDYDIMRSRTQAGEQQVANANYWFEHELRQYTSVGIDTEIFSAWADRIVPAFGRASAGYPTAEAASVLAAKLNIQSLSLPDGHVGYATNPGTFAGELVDRLKRA